MVSTVEITEGVSPLVLGLPHTGTDMPDDCVKVLNELGRGMADTDWNIHELYAGLTSELTTVRTTIHRYVIDVNRDPSGVSLYPGQNTTNLCPLTDFDGNAIYQTGQHPDVTEVARRTHDYHRPYHAALEAQLDRVRQKHGFAILYDCHSIRSDIPFLFDGTLPDFNIGTNEGETCDIFIEAAVTDICTLAAGYNSVVNGRFKGGWTTRHYGRPSEGLHAIQMELAQSTYMLERPPWTYEPAKADGLRIHLTKILETLSAWSPTQ